jgi:hypothetical protein
VPARPALLTGTSSEYLGRRPFPRILRDRHTVVVLGPGGVGKTAVAQRLANPAGIADGRAVPIGELVYLDTNAVQDALVARVATRAWSDRLVEARSLVLDGPVWLRNRPAAVAALCELIRARADACRRTLIVQNEEDCSVDTLIASMEPGEIVVIGLRFPKGPRGRLRFARRACDELGIARTAARGTDLIEPWGYARVIDFLRAGHADPAPIARLRTGELR